MVVLHVHAWLQHRQQQQLHKRRTDLCDCTQDAASCLQLTHHLQGAKLDGPVAGQVGVGRQAPRVACHQVAEHVRPVLGREVCFVQWDAQVRGHLQHAPQPCLGTLSAYSPALAQAASLLHASCRASDVQNALQASAWQAAEI